MCDQLGQAKHLQYTAQMLNYYSLLQATQYSCDFPNLAPQGCTQYYYGSAKDRVQTYNYNGGGGQHLADQAQAICVRRERGNCR